MRSERLFVQIQALENTASRVPRCQLCGPRVLPAWLKCHEPAAYAGLLNSLPMGFYSADQLLQDARRHGLEIRPVDVQASHWDYT